MAKNNACSAIWRDIIGHYGGHFVDVPKEHWVSFKQAFPKRQLPRRITKKTVTKTLSPEGEARFHKRFPRSLGQYYEVHFAHGTKGLSTFDKLQSKCRR